MQDSTIPVTPQYTELPDRARKAMEGLFPDEALIVNRVGQFRNIQPRMPDRDGDQEVFDGVTFTRRFVDAPGDHENVSWHYVEAGEGEAIVFLHGIPDSWFQWVHQMSALSKTHRCIAVDLKGYGQSCNGPGDYRHEGAAEQLYAMLHKIGVSKFNLVTHDRGTVQGDFIDANHPDSVLRYARGEQHLYHFNPALEEQVAFDRREITSRDWSGYPILKFPEVPSVEVVLVDRSDPSLGVGEGSLPPTSAALANAFAHATGRRMRSLPMTPERVKASLS